MWRDITRSVVWQHLVRGIVLLGSASCGAAGIYAEYHRAQQESGVEPEPDWSIPHLWYDEAHRSGRPDLSW
ncbi:hypothetical protein [Nocardia blacklockiae]|uniref:hypothetical protein n=1 Tax=Nocardia blacklockiae TaxID=480036 RepID=UPI001893DCE8|nr:hypothetical protein [Nocardia blacklockiae]MBF6169954.1 hypothetical protein [Nocardia blacklockiae]